MYDYEVNSLLLEFDLNSITWADAAAGTRDGRVITYRIPISII